MLSSSIIMTFVAAIQFSFGQITLLADIEAIAGTSTVDALVPIVLSINPPTTILQSENVVIVSVTGGDATRRSLLNNSMFSYTTGGSGMGRFRFNYIVNVEPEINVVSFHL